MAEQAARARRADDAYEPRRARPDLRVVDDPPRSRAPDPGRRTVQITGQARAPRRRSTGTAVGRRPDRIAAWAVLLGLFLVLTAAATAHSAPYSHATLGARSLHRGDAGYDVRTLQRVLSMKGYGVGVDGRFGRQTKRAVKRFQRRRHIRADGVVGPGTTRALASSWRPRMASYFGPGLYGNRTACGQILRHRTTGIAHRTLPCGRRVAVFHSGRVVVLPVIDRGPFTSGVAFDVTANAARRLVMRSTRSVRAGY
jgi:rare lipoprotein A (peptidoglycan hydrolase)